MAVDFQGTGALHISESLTEDRLINHYWSSSESASNGFGSCGSSSEDLNTETESDDEDFIAELNRQMADYMLKEEDDVQKPAPNSVSHNSKSGKKLAGSLGKTSSLHAHTKSTNITGLVHSNQSFADDQIQPAQFDYGLRNQQGMKNRGYVSLGKRGKTNEQQLQRKSQHNTQAGYGGIVYPLCLSQSGPGMRAVFLGGSGTRSAANGTGVFLPRGSQIMPEPRKKKGCSTVLIPARVLQTLKLHFSTLDTLQNSNGCGSFTAQPNQHANSAPSYSDVVVSGAQQKRHVGAQTRPTIKNQQELQLPKEWTY